MSRSDYPEMVSRRRWLTAFVVLLALAVVCLTCAVWTQDQRWLQMAGVFAIPCFVCIFPSIP